MYNNYDYPMGADTPSAPWNQSEPPYKDFNVLCSQTLSKSVTVSSNSYMEGIDVEFDDDGRKIGCPYCDTEDTDWAEEFHENGFHTPIQLLALFREVLKKDMENGIVFKTPRFTESLMAECEGWMEDEVAYMEE